MFEEKESFWKKKGFYLSACAAILCVLAIGTVYYKFNYQNNNGKNLFADSATTAPDNATSDVVGGPAISESADDTTDNSNSEDAISVAQNNIQENIPDEQPDSTPTPSSSVKDTANDSQKDNTTEKNVADANTVTNKSKKETDLADSSKTAKSKNSTENKDNKKNTEKQENNKTGSSDSKSIKNTDNTVATMTETGTKNKFDMEKGLLWPVTGDIILKYSMSNTVYFKTLAQYKCNPAIIISSEEGTNVRAAADGTVSKVTKSDETGNLVIIDIGSGYTVTYGQLDDISVKEGQFVKEGSSIGKIAKPTKYYSEEGSNLYLQVTENDKPVDPMLLLR